MQAVPHRAARTIAVASEDEAESVKYVTNKFLVLFLLAFFFLFLLSNKLKGFG